MRHLRISFILTFMLTSLSIFAQKARLYTSETGLPNSQINSISQDSRGFLWVSTENGLSRFDGIEFSNFRSDKTDPGALASDLVLMMYEDSYGTMWVGTSTGLQVYDPLLSTFTKIDLNDPYVPLSSVHVSSIVQVGDELWFAGSQHGVYVIDLKTKTLKGNRRNELSGILPSSFVNLIFQDSSGRVWFSSETGGLTVIDSEKRNITDIWDNETAPFSKDAFVTCFAEDSLSGDILIGTFNRGIFLYDNSIGKIRRLGKEASSCRAMSFLQSDNGESSSHGSFLVGTEDKGLMSIDIESGELSEFKSQSIPYKMGNWKVHSLLRDNQGNIWIGAYDTGVLVIPKSMYGFEYISASPDPYSQNFGACVTSLLEDKRDGSLWVGTDGGGIMKISPDGKRTFLNQDNSALTNNSVLDLVQDKRGTIWIATFIDGLMSLSPSGEIRRFHKGDELGTIRTARLLYDENKDILYVGTYGNGMSVISLPEGHVLTTVSEDRCKWVSSLYMDSKGTIWVGTFNGPLCYNPETGRLSSYSIQPSRVYSLFEGSSGEMWIGTGDGLMKFRPSEENATVYTEHDGLSSNVISGILEDRQGILWISTSYGLCRMDREEQTFSTFYSYDGLQENEFRYGSAFMAKDGKMYFGGINGITAINPGVQDLSPHTMPAVFLTSLSVMNQKVNYTTSEGSRFIDRPITEAKKITLPFNSASFSLGFAVLEYTNPRKIVFSYILEKAETQWHRTDATSNVANYSKLRPGKYNFIVKAFFDGNEENFSTTSISVKVMAPWYLSPGAFIFYLLALLGLFMLFRHDFIRKRIQAQQQEENEIKEMKLRMFTNMSHEIRTPLTLVLSPLKKMREDEKDPHRRDLYNLMYRNGLRINRIVNQIMDMRKIDDGQMPMHFRETDIVYFIKDIMQTFSNLAQDKNISFTLESEQDDLEIWIDQGNFDKVIFNLLSNAFKHTPDGGRIQIQISAPQDNTDALPKEIDKVVKIGIFNSGSHIDEQYLERVFDRFFQVDIMDAKVGSGVGLNLTKQLVGLHHGTVKAENKDTEGVLFTVTLPLGNKHLSEEEMSQTSHHKDLYTKNIEEMSASTEDLSFTPSEVAQKSTKTKKTLVIVDDDAEIRSYIAMEMRDFYNVQTYASAEEAWGAISTDIPDLVISDLMMEGMDGAQLCSKIRHNPGTNHIPVVILTSSTDEESVQRCTECGADRYFTKPISVELLRSVVANTISNRDIVRNKYTNPIEYDYSGIQMTSATEHLTKRVVEVINAHIEDPDFSVEDLSHEIGISRVHMNRKLKETIGMSPSSLIKSIRLKQAAYLLIHDEVNISEVAYRVGFSTHSYFSSSFRDYFGMTPKEFVAKHVGCTDEETLKKIFN